MTRENQEDRAYNETEVNKRTCRVLNNKLLVCWLAEMEERD